MKCGYNTDNAKNYDATEETLNQIENTMGAFAVDDHDGMNMENVNECNLNNEGNLNVKFNENDSFRFEFSPNGFDDLEKNSDLVMSMMSRSKSHLKDKLEDSSIFQSSNAFYIWDRL